MAAVSRSLSRNSPAVLSTRRPSTNALSVTSRQIRQSASPAPLSTHDFGRRLRSTTSAVLSFDGGLSTASDVTPSTAQLSADLPSTGYAPAAVAAAVVGRRSLSPGHLSIVPSSARHLTVTSSTLVRHPLELSIGSSLSSTVGFAAFTIRRSASTDELLGVALSTGRLSTAALSASHRATAIVAVSPTSGQCSRR